MPSALEIRVNRRLSNCVEDAEGCWVWQGRVNEWGYSTTWFEGKGWKGHQLTYAYFIGDVPDGLVLDHLCRKPACCNPYHLEPVTHRVNIQRGNAGKFNRAKTHCPSGHPYDEVNTYWRGEHRHCWTCLRMRRRT